MIVSFVSGKGGVGKTSLAANFAWVSAQSRKTVLIDLDLQNQGLTGLLERFTSDLPLGAFELLADRDKAVDFNSCFAEVSKGLFFLPARSSRVDPSATRLAGLVANPVIGGAIQHRLAELKEAFGYEALILDCHGGLDYLSLGAHHASDVTIMVTEADTVTFNGTLELLSFYQTVPVEMAETSLVEDRSTNTVTRVVVNRVPPKYRFADLNFVYKGIVKKVGAEYNLAPEVLSFFPQEDFLVSSFGEYPFCSELAPNSVFAKKLWLMDFALSNGQTLKGKTLVSRKIRSARFRKKVERCLTSNETMNTQRMLSAFSVLTVAFAMYLLASFPVAILTRSSDTLSEKITKHPLFSIAFMWIGTFLLIATVWSLCRAMWGAAKFYSDKYWFNARLWTVLGRRLRLGERIILGRLLILRFAFSLSLLFFGFFLAIMLLAVLFEGPFISYFFYKGTKGLK